MEGLKIAVTGKGGVGKTTLTSLLALTMAKQGRHVLAIDADPSPCLGAALGIPSEARATLRPIAEMDELILERTGAEPGSSGGYFKLNPRVDDLPERFSLHHRGIRLLELGGVELGGSGCICPESTILRALVTHILLRKDEAVLLDLYAGVEHLGRATADAVDAMLVVVEPTSRSLATASQIAKLAGDLGLSRVYLVANKVRGEDDQRFVVDHAGRLPVLATFGDDPAVLEADRSGQAAYDLSPDLRRAAVRLMETVTSQLDLTRANTPHA
ncbi:MAG: AAA family ATPase [Anaerolineales bacterium]